MARRVSRTDVILVLVAVALLVVWFFVPRSEPNDGFAVANWADIVAESPDTIVIRRGGEQLILLRRPDGEAAERYFAKAPDGVRADPATVDRLILSLSRLEVERCVDKIPADAGLARPWVEVELDTRDGKRLITIGNTAPSPKDARYAAITRKGKPQLVVLSAASARALDVTPEALLDHRVFDFVPSELRQLEWTASDGPLALVRDADGHWTFATPPKARARRTTVERLTLGLAELSLTKHLDPLAATARMRDGQVRVIKILARSNERDESVKLRVGGTCLSSNDQLTLVTEGEHPAAGCVEARAFEALLPTRAALFDDAVFSLHVDEIEQLEVTGHDPAWTLKRDGSAFRFQGEKELTVALATGNGLLYSLVSVHGTSPMPCDFAAPRDQRQLTLKSYVVGDGGPSTESVLLGAIAADGTRKICRDDGTELALNPASSRLLELDPVLLRDPSLLDVPIEAVIEVRIESQSRHALLRIDEHNRFVMVEPQRPVLDAAMVETLREHLAQLHAARWLISPEKKPLLAQPHDLSIDFFVTDRRDVDGGTPEKPSRHQLRLMLDGPTGVVLGWFDREPTPFQLEASFAELVTGVAQSFAESRTELRQ